jgi:acyl carrier protein
MNEAEIEDRVRTFLTGNFLLDPDVALERDESLLENGIVDSTGMLEVIQFLEENFGIQVDDLEVLPENLDSVANLTNYIGYKLKTVPSSVA